MCKIQTLLSLSIGVLSLASVRGQNCTHKFCEDGGELTNVTANYSGSCVLFGEYEDLPVNDTGKLFCSKMHGNRSVQ